jgi:hypothetical protein
MIAATVRSELKKKSELKNLTAEEIAFNKSLKDGYFCYFQFLTNEAQEKVIKYVQNYLESEVDDDIVLNLFFTHGQSLEVFFTDDMHREDMKEMAEQLEEHLKIYFNLNFVCRSLGKRSMGFIVDKNQVV